MIISRPADIKIEDSVRFGGRAARPRAAGAARGALRGVFRAVRHSFVRIHDRMPSVDRGRIVR